jgi:hypothetical protein
MILHLQSTTRLWLKIRSTPIPFFGCALGHNDINRPESAIQFGPPSACWSSPSGSSTSDWECTPACAKRSGASDMIWWRSWPVMDNHVWVPMHTYHNLFGHFMSSENITALNKRLNLKQNNRCMILPTRVIQIQLTNNT